MNAQHVPLFGGGLGPSSPHPALFQKFVTKQTFYLPLWGAPVLPRERLQLKEASDEPRRCPGRERRAIILSFFLFLSYPVFKLPHTGQRDGSLPKLGRGLTGVHFIGRFHNVRIC